jgi:STE24 endopeptidase
MSSVLIAVGVSALLMYLEAGVVFSVVRRRAEQIERSSASLPDRLHRLQRTALKATWAAAVVNFVLLSVPSGIARQQPHRSHHRDLAHALVLVLVIIVVAAVMMSAALSSIVAVQLAARPSYARMRDVPRRATNQFRVLALVVLVGALFGAAVAALDHVSSAHGSGHLIAIVGGYVGLIVALQTLLPPLLVKALRCKPPPADIEARMRALADRMGVRVRGFVTYPGHSQRRANAFQIGIIPRLRYVAVSDYLLENLTPEEADAVVAHELGHARGHHLLLKLGTIAAIWAVFQTGLVSAAGLTDVHQTTAAVLILPLALAFPIGIFVIRGLLGVRLEERADDAAASVVGTDHVVAALDKLAELNDSKRDTGRGWALVTQHPGFDRRLARLRTSSTADWT